MRVTRLHPPIGTWWTWPVSPASTALAPCCGPDAGWAPASGWRADRCSAARASATTRRVARGVPALAAEAKALASTERAKVLTTSMLEAMMFSRSSTTPIFSDGNQSSGTTR